jgi:hypothetical protein
MATDPSTITIDTSAPHPVIDSKGMMHPAGYVEPTGTPATIVTSSQSRTNYNNNATTLNNVNTALTDAQIAAKNAAADASNSKYADAQAGKVKASTDTTTTPKTTPVSTVTNPDGSTVGTNADGSSVLTYPDGTSYKLAPGVDATTAKLGYDNIRDLKTNSDNLKTIMDNALVYENNDPIAIQAAQQISNTYDQLIKTMEAKNNILGGMADVSIARYGGLGIMNEQQRTAVLQAGVARVADLQQKKIDAITKSNAAYKAGDVKAFEQASKDYQNSLKESQNAIGDLQKTINDQIKTHDAEIKQAQTQIRQQTIDDHNFATQNARDIATTLKNNGITDINSPEGQKVLQDAADTYGISNPNVLFSAVENEQAKMKKEDLANAHSEAINNKLLNPTAPKATAAERETTAVDGFSSYMVPGAKDPKGTPIIDDNGFITPTAWNSLIKLAPQKGLTRAKFIQAFADKIYTDENGNVSKAYKLTPVEVKKYIVGALPANSN